MVWKPADTAVSSAEGVLTVSVPNMSICPLAPTAGTSTGNSSPSTCCAILRNSSSANNSRKASLSGSCTSIFSGRNSRGTSQWMVASERDRRAISALFSIFSLSLPLSSWVRCNRFSIVPNCCTSCVAVFSPTPGTPGILSTESPINPRMSITWSGRSMP